MQDPLQIPLQRLEATIQAIKPQLVHAIGVEALGFIDDNFRSQGYNGRTFHPWAPRKSNKRPGGAILVQTGALRRSFSQADAEDSTRISTDIPYARVHNEGARGPVYVRSRMGTFGKPFTRNQNTPQRQFIPITADDAPMLLRRCKSVIIRKITNALPK